MRGKNLLTVIFPKACKKKERMKSVKMSWFLYMLTVYFLSGSANLHAWCGTSNRPVGNGAHAYTEVTTSECNVCECTPEYEVWQINLPNVNQDVTSYYIFLQPDDIVNVTAGGCVQIGGSGHKTWKRYCNPLGPKSNTYYQGLIDLPGYTDGFPPPLGNFKYQGLVPIKDISVIGDPTTHPDPNDPLHYADVCMIQNVHVYGQSGSYLLLGYLDDAYNDNGYYDPDNGDDDQCKDENVSNITAYLRIAISHTGTPPPQPPPFTGIAPDDFRCSAAWKFGNFDTSELSWNTFKDAFDFQWFDWLNPVTYIMFGAGKGMAAGGNCFGMSLLSLIGEDYFRVGDLQEYFWSNYPYRTVSPPLKDINTAHWEQMSLYYITKWLHSHFGAASTAAKSAQEDLANGNYGLLSLSHRTDGHIVVPLSVETNGSEYWIYVYDPNYPCSNPTEDYHSYPKVIINGNNWSYEFDRDNNVTWTQSDGDIAYVPYHPDWKWRDLVNGLEEVLLIIFSNSTNVEQMTDKNGRQLFKNSNPQGPADVDRSANGLGNDIVRIPILGWGHTIPRDPAGPPFVLTSPPEPSEYIDTTNQMMAEYEPDYSFSGQFDLVQNLQLEQLEMQLSNSDPNKPVRALINRQEQGQWYEVKCDGAGNGAAIHPSLTVQKTSDLSRSVTVRERDGVSVRCQFVHGLISMVYQNITIQQADAVDVGTATITAQINKDNSLQLFTTGQDQQTSINTRVIDSTGTVQNIPVRTQTVHPKITCPSNITVECSAHGGTPASDPTIAAFLSGAQATDNCECVPVIRNSAPGLFPPGSTKVEWTAADADNNVDAGSICSANVTVVDKTPPVIACPPAVTMECQSARQANVNVPPAAASDTCSGAATIVNDHTANGADASGSYPLGTTVVTYVATDGSGNSATCTTTVAVADTTPPVIGVSLNPNVLWPPNHKMVDIAASVAVTDKCDPSPTFVLTSIISNEPDNGLGDGDTVNDIQKADIGKPDVQFQLRAERSGKGNGRVYTIVYTASDGSNNKALATGYVRVPHN